MASKIRGNNRMKHIGIIGLGYVGKALKKRLISEKFHVYSWSRSLNNPENFEFSFHLENDFELNIDVELIKSLDAIIYTIPPTQTGFDYLKRFKEFIHFIKRLKPGIRFVFLSSTGVFGNQIGEFDENDKIIPTSERSKLLAELEEAVINRFQTNFNVLRLGGIIGPERHPVKSLAKRKQIKGKNHPLSLCYLDDISAAMVFLLNLTQMPKIVHLVSPNHVLKSEYYNSIAKSQNLGELDFDQSDTSSGKKILSNCLDKLNFEFKYPSPIDYPIQ